MKRIATLIIPAAFILCLAGCSGNNASSSDSSSPSSERYEETTSDSSQDSDSSSSTYIETDDRERKTILTDSSDYQADDSEARYTYAQLNDIVYHGLGNTFGDILDYSGRSSDPSYVGFGNHGLEGTYYTHFDNTDSNQYLMFRTSSDTYFNANDYCYGAKGWLKRVFDYEQTQGPCKASAFADILGAKNTYTISSWPDEYYVPSNLDTSNLFVIEANLQTASGVRSCIILLEAESESFHLSSDSWVEVLIQ